VSHRALMLGGLAVGATTVEGFLDSEDCLATLAALRAMGVTIERPSAHAVRVEVVGLHGLRGDRATARHGQRRYGDAALHGLAGRSTVRLDAGRRFLADEAPDGARGGTVAADGRDDRNRRR
jgi:hypothetical protein